MNLSSFKTYVKLDFKRTDKDTELVQAYNDAIVYVASHIPHGNYKYQSYLPTVAKQEDYPLPTNINHLMHPVKILDGLLSTDTGRQLNHITKEKYDERYPNANRTDPPTGDPEDYCIYSRSILLGPIPRVATQYIEIDWTILPTTQALDADVHYLGTEWDEVLKWMTLYRLYLGLGQSDEAYLWKAQYEDGQENPIGNFKRLLEKEMDLEGRTIGQVKNNDL